MNTELYIGTIKADFNGPVTVLASCGDIREPLSGAVNKTYSIELQHTPLNCSILKYANNPTVFTEIDDLGFLYLDNVLIIQGRIYLLNIYDVFKLIISNDDWVASIKGNSLKDLDFSSEDHEYNGTNVENSWSGADKFYRYPMINFGALRIAPGDWIVEDFTPVFRAKSILEKILASWTITSAFWATSFAKNQYISCQEPVMDKDYLEEKALDVAVNDTGDNFDTDTIPPAGSRTVTINKVTYATRATISNEATDEGANFASNEYEIPEDGTYRFKIDYSAQLDYYNLLRVTDYELTVKIMKEAATELATETITAVNNTNTGTIDTSFFHATAGEKVWFYLYFTVTADNTSGVDEIIEIYTNTATRLYTEIDEWWRYAAVGKTIEIADYMPDIDQLDFLLGLKHCYNLVFFADRPNKTIYIEPLNDFWSDTVIDLTDKLDKSDKPSFDYLSKDFYKTTRLRFANDSSDKALELNFSETQSILGSKDITLTSPYVQDGIGELENPVFAPAVTGISVPAGWIYSSHPMPRIWGDMDEDSLFPTWRLTNYVPRIFEWIGLTGCPTFGFEGGYASDYPKITPLDYSDLHDDYFLKSVFHWNRGRILSVQVIMNAHELQKFFTVLDTAADEGFRPKYKLLIDDDYIYCRCVKIEGDGRRASMDLLIL